MFLKRFLTACSISLLVSFPQNIIGCGGEIDPYDYYTSFFWNDQVDQRGYNPFYYTGMQNWYAETDSFDMESINTQSWKQYFLDKPASKDVQRFIYTFSYKDVSILYSSIEKNNLSVLPDSIKKNGVADWFVANKDLEALGYIMYAKQVEPHVTGNWDYWEPVKRDSVKMSGLIRNGLQLYKAAKKEDIKLRLAYQAMRLAHYSKRYDDCINFYNLYVKNNNSVSFLKPICLAHKAGAFYGKRQIDSAAYLFSLAFAQSDLNRISNMQSFEWSCIADSGRARYLQLCKTNAEKANMLGMFAMRSASDQDGGLKDEINELKTIASLDPSSPLLEIITAREINKIEEIYFTPALYKASGKEMEYYYRDQPVDEKMKAYPGKIKDFGDLLLSFAANKKISNSGFYTLAAAHLAFVGKDYASSEASLAKAKDMQLNPKQKDQWNLTKLLVTINKQQNIDAAFEASILAELKWLAVKAGSNETWTKFYRDVYIEVLGEKYHQQKDIARQALCIVAGNRFGYGGSALDFLRENMNSHDLLTLNSLLESKKRNALDDYIISVTTFSANDVKDVIVTSFIRENNWIKAEEWLKKIPASYYKTDPYKTYLAANSFADLLYDTHVATKQDTVIYTKLKFVQKMIQLEKQLVAATDNNKKAKIHYQLANGLYQMSYWGNSWLLQTYDWSGSEANWSKKENNWLTEYYGVYHAEENYKKAFELSSDPEFKARCLFMSAKCDQKQVDMSYEAEEKNLDDFMLNKNYFPQLVKDYNRTSFYKQAFNTCSYLRDFVKKNK
jgi:hypothetical protein